MNEHVGKICPHCNTPILEGHPVVACNVCGVVHHAGCWQAYQGCSTNGCAANPHTVPAPVPAAEPAPVAAPAPAPAPTNCTACGTPVAEGQAFCANCGHNVAAEPAPAPVAQAPNYAPNYGYAPVAPVNPAIDQFNAAVQQQNVQKKKKPIGIIAGVLAAILILFLVIGNAGPKVDSITLSDASIELRVDDTYTVNYVISPSSSASADVKWTSSNTSVATVTSTGKIVAVGEGSCVITAKAGKKTDTLSVTVKALLPQEEMLIGTWSVVGFLKDGDITQLASSASTTYMYSSLSGKMVTGDTTMEFTWEYVKYDDGNYYYTAVTSDGGKMNFIYMSEYEYLVFDLGSMQVIFE